jgi:hypothetical protein
MSKAAFSPLKQRFIRSASDGSNHQASSSVQIHLYYELATIQVELFCGKHEEHKYTGTQASERSLQINAYPICRRNP